MTSPLPPKDIVKIQKQIFPPACFPPVNGVVCPVSKLAIRDSVPDALPPACPGARLSKTLNDPNKSLAVVHNGPVLPLFPHYCWQYARSRGELEPSLASIKSCPALGCSTTFSTWWINCPSSSHFCFLHSYLFYFQSLQPWPGRIKGACVSEE